MTIKEDFGVIRQIHTVLAMHFVEGHKQSEIASKLNMSTAKVNRLIKQGRELGMVKISISSPYERLVDLEKELTSRWPIDSALVTPAVSGNPDTVLKQVGTAAGTLLSESIRDGAVIAATGGKAVSALIDNLNVDRKFDVTVVPLTGCVQGKHYTDVNHVATMLAEKLGGKAMLIHAPLFAESKKERDMLLSLRQIGEVLDVARNADLALTGLGSILTPSSSYYDLHPIPVEERQKLVEEGAVGEFVAHLIGNDGQPCAIEMNEKLVALSPSEVANIPKIIGIASGQEKVKPVQSVLNGNHLSSIVIDEATAGAVLGLKQDAA